MTNHIIKINDEIWLVDHTCKLITKILKFTQLLKSLKIKPNFEGIQF